MRFQLKQKFGKADGLIGLVCIRFNQSCIETFCSKKEDILIRLVCIKLKFDHVIYYCVSEEREVNDDDPYDPEEGPELIDEPDEKFHLPPDLDDDDDDDEEFHHRDDDENDLLPEGGLMK